MGAVGGGQRKLLVRLTVGPVGTMMEELGQEPTAQGTLLGT